MKKFILFILSLSFVYSFSLAYMPTQKDLSDLMYLKSQLNTLISGNNVDSWNFYNQIVNLKSDYSGDDRINYMLDDLEYYLYSDTKNNKSAFSKQKTDAKTISKQDKQNFFDEFSSGISVDIEDSLKNCTGWYRTLDDISFAYDFPTALTISVWYRETSCAYYSPNNGDGPFQIRSKDYKTGSINQREFVGMITDFMEFSKDKLNRYEGLLSGNLSYNSFDMTGLVNFASLYNGGTRSGNLVLPNNEKYVYDGYGEAFSGSSRYGILPQTLKVLGWELENTY